MSTIDRTELRRRDARARERAQLVFDRPFVLEAGAGTGKTSSLVARILAWCIGPGWKLGEERFDSSRVSKRISDNEVRERVAGEVLSRVSAITFTEAAAAEMSTRVGRGLVELMEGREVEGLLADRLDVGAEEIRARAAVLVGTLDHLVVCTIHAWCRRLLARYPLECGWHPNFEVDADGRLEEGVVRAQVESALRNAYREGEGSPLFDLAVEGHGPAAIEEAIAGLMGHGVDGDRLGVPVFSEERVGAALSATRDLLEDLRLRIGDRLDGVGGNSKRTLAARDALSSGIEQIDSFALEHLASESGIESLEEWIETFAEIFDAKVIDRLVKWGKSDYTGAEKDGFGTRAAEIADRSRATAARLTGIVSCRPGAFERARRALTPLVAGVCGEMQSRGIASFGWLLVQARNLLRDRPDVRARVRDEMDQLLVDEFQDTSALQCEIVRFLALEGDRENRPGLFLVGDPKQSIYGWRQADLRAYDAFVSEAKRAGGEVARLTVNYRSVPAILDEVSQVIEPVMQEREGMQPRFQPLVVSPDFEKTREPKPGSPTPVEYWLSWLRDPGSGELESGLRAASVVDLEAGFLAEDLRRQHDEHGVAWSDMAILLRSATKLDRVLEALKNRGVPYAVERDRSYYRRREVIDAAGLVRAVMDPQDSVALVTLLRSSVVGVPDAAWLPLWRRGFPEAWSQLHAARPEVLADLIAMAGEVAAEVEGLEGEIDGLDRVRGWERNLASLFEVVAVLRESYGADPPDVFVERLRTLTLFEVIESGRYLGAYRQSNLERFFRELVVEWVEEADPQKILRRLRSDVFWGREAEEAPPQGSGFDAVRIMTIHKAKGLDFEHVYVAQLSRKPGGAIPDPVEVRGDPDALEFGFLGMGSMGLEWERSRSKAVEQLERVRTLYVAMTRAKSRLVLIGAWPEQPRACTVEEARNSMDLLQSRVGLPSDLRQWMEGAEADVAGLYRVSDGVRWVLPNPVRGRAGSAPKVQRGASEPADRAPLDLMAENLREANHRAQKRMSRRFGASVTSERRRQETYAGEEEVPERSIRFEARETSQEAAIAAGIAIHRALEEFRFDEEPRAELQFQRDRLPQWLAHIEADSVRDEAIARAREVIDGFAEGPLFERFAALGPQVMARELDVWVAPEIEDEGVVAYRSGAVDLLCRDSAGDWIVMDFKSDAVSAAEAVERARQYAFQGKSYARAVQAALGLEALPRFELWFLGVGVVVEV